MRLNHNMLSLSAFNTYKKSLASNSSALERISTGLKINSAKDNPNKIAQSEQMRIQIKCLETANRNVQDTYSMVQTAEGAMQEASNMINRMRELAVSAADGSKSEGDIEAIQKELDELKAGLNDLANNTEFNGIKLLGNKDVSSNKYPVHISTVVGAQVGENINVPQYNITTTVLKDSKGNTIEDIDLSTPEKANAALKTFDEVIGTVGSIRSKYGSLIARFESTSENLEANIYISESAESSIRDADIAVEMMEIARTNILSQSSIGLIAQTNEMPQDCLRILQNVRR